MTTSDLIRQLQRKDKEAIALLYNRYGRKLYGYACRRWQLSEDEAWEMVYKTLYKVIGVMDRYTFDTDAKFNGFVFQVFVNHLRNLYQEKKRKSMPVLELPEHLAAPPEEEPDSREPNIYMRCLKSILDEFDDWKRVLLLMKSQQYSYEEIAAYVSKPAEQLKVYYMRAKQALVEKVNACVERGES